MCLSLIFHACSRYHVLDLGPRCSGASGFDPEQPQGCPCGSALIRRRSTRPCFTTCPVMHQHVLVLRDQELVLLASRSEMIRPLLCLGCPCRRTTVPVEPRPASTAVALGRNAPRTARHARKPPVDGPRVFLRLLREWRGPSTSPTAICLAVRERTISAPTGNEIRHRVDRLPWMRTSSPLR